MAATGPSERRAETGPLLEAFLDQRDSLVLFLAVRVRSMATAEDLVQDLYLKIRGLDPQADLRSPKALLYRMALNTLVDHVRSSQRASRRDGQWRLDTHVTVDGYDVAGEPGADEVLVEKERTRQLAEAVAALPPQMGRAFRLHKLEGRSQVETAEAMGVSRKMVEAHIAAAIKHLTLRLRG